MQLTEIEVKCYLSRFFDELVKVGTVEIGTLGFELVCNGTEKGPYIVNKGSPEMPIIKVFPALLENFGYFDFEARMLGLTNLTDVSIWIDDYEPARVPLVMSFDMRRDIATFLNLVSSIKGIRFTPPVESQMEVEFEHFTYR